MPAIGDTPPYNTYTICTPDNLCVGEDNPFVCLCVSECAIVCGLVEPATSRKTHSPQHNYNEATVQHETLLSKRIFRSLTLYRTKNLQWEHRGSTERIEYSFRNPIFVIVSFVTPNHASHFLHSTRNFRRRGT